MSFLESINLFPETRYFRVRRTAQLNHQCGGLSSLFILLALALILFLKLYEAFKKQTVFVTSQTIVDLQPRLTNISTYMNQTSSVPYMLAVELYSLDCWTVTYNINAYIVTYFDNDKPTWYQVDELVPLETCTAEHFKLMPQLWEQADALEMQNWRCLPINRRFQLGGNAFFSPLHKRLQIRISCSNSCPLDNCGRARIFQVATQVNAHNQQPFEYYLQTNNLNIGERTNNQYDIQLSQNTLTTDQSLLPGSNLISQNSFDIEPLDHKITAHKDYKQQTVLSISRSTKTRLVQRKYLKLIDVLSYVGGIFPSLFGLFFFMKAFGMYFFQMTFAYQHFKCRQTKYNHFGQFMKITLYKVISGIGCAPTNWKIAKRQNQINQLVNKMLDINYLYKRIQFLQSAISVLLNEHQLKGVYLSQVTLKKADVYYSQHRIRDRIVTFLNKKAKEVKQKKMKEKKQQANKEIELNRPVKSKININQKDMEFEAPQSAMKLQISQNRINDQEYNLTLNADVQDGLLPLRQRNKILLAQDAAMLDPPLQQKELDQFQLEEQLEHDLRKLFKEARKKKGDPVSKRIVENIDQWLRIELEIAIDEFEEANPRFQMKLRDTEQTIQ